MNRIAIRAWAMLVVVAILLGGFGFFLWEYFTKGSGWVIVPGSPHVYNGENIGCGVVVDRDSILLLDLRDGRGYSDSLALRRATVHWVGDRFGSISAPALSYYAGQMAGFDYFNGIYNYGQTGGVAELTLSAAMQTVALEALGDYKGTVAVYNYKTGQLLCAVTAPTYDPDNVPQFAEGDPSFEGLYVNRFTQSAYTPGSIFKIVTLAAALEENPDIVHRTFSCTGSALIGAQKIICDETHWDQTLKQAFCNSCNCAFAQIALELGAEKLNAYVEKFGVAGSVSFDGITTAAGNFRVLETEQANVAWAGVGQYLDLVNPCAFLAFVGAVANDGKATQPYLVERISVDGVTTYDALHQPGEQLISPETAAILRQYMQNNVAVKYGAENFHGLTAGAKTGTAEVEGQKPNAMLAGFLADENMPLAFIVCVEDAGYGKTVCIPIVSKVLKAAAQALK
ncbi:MAG: penicillin-binding protein [Oscillospiraceae bacterium]|nr:penicillin-binding protein [Oscillospiraceae bacterium]